MLIMSFCSSINHEKDFLRNEETNILLSTSIIVKIKYHENMHCSFFVELLVISVMEANESVKIERLNMQLCSCVISQNIDTNKQHLLVD